MAKRRSNYFKKKPLNNAVLAVKLEKLEQKIQNHRNDIDAVIKNYETHVKLLASFARHDMKNSVQNMDSILNTLYLNEITEQDWISLKKSLDDIRTTVDNFSKLTPVMPNDQFDISELITAINLISRQNIHKSNISYNCDYPRKNKVIICQSFHSLLQVLNNLIINSIKALDGIENPIIKLEVNFDEENCTISILDNGKKILEEYFNKVFEYGFSTTSGSGIGLYHAKYICEDIGGSIILDTSPHEVFTKKFIFQFPYKSDQISSDE